MELTYYLNDVSNSLTQVLMTYGEEGNFNAAYTYGLERISVEAVDGTRPESQDPLYYLYDGLGSVTFLVKPDGNKRDHYRYDEFGKPAPGNSKLSQDGKNVLHNTFGYTGEMWDEEAELLYLRARYYEPETGRFLSRDCYWGNMRNPLSRNLYSYVQNNPVNRTDPSGHIWLEYGMKDNDDAEMLQIMLNELKLYNGGIDGDFGSLTEEAVNKYKDTRGLGNINEWHGVVGNQTWDWISKEYWEKLLGPINPNTKSLNEILVENSTPIFNQNDNIYVFACHAAACNNKQMNEVTVRNPDYYAASYSLKYSVTTFIRDRFGNKYFYKGFNVDLTIFPASGSLRAGYLDTRDADENDIEKFLKGYGVSKFIGVGIGIAKVESLAGHGTAVEIALTSPEFGSSVGHTWMIDDVVNE